MGRKRWERPTKRDRIAVFEFAFRNIYFMWCPCIGHGLSLVHGVLRGLLYYMERMAHWRCGNFRFYSPLSCGRFFLSRLFVQSFVIVAGKAGFLFVSVCRSFCCLWPLSQRKMSIRKIQTMKNDTNELHTNILSPLPWHSCPTCPRSALSTPFSPNFHCFLHVFHSFVPFHRSSLFFLVLFSVSRLLFHLHQFHPLGSFTLFCPLIILT